MSVDCLLESLGKRNIVIIFWYVTVHFFKSATSCAAMFSFVWANARPYSIRCTLPPGRRPENSVPYEDIRNKLIPSQCLQYVNYSKLTNKTKPCELGYTYESYMNSSTVMQWDLVCGKEYLAALADSSFFILSVLTSSIFSGLGDHFGRRPVFSICLFLLCGIGTLQTLSSNAPEYILFRLILGPLQQGTYVVGYCFCLELFPKSHRSVPSLMSKMLYVLSSCCICLIAYFVREWKIYYYITNMPFIVGIIFFCIMPESIPWLFAQGKTDEAFNTLKNMTFFMKNREAVTKMMEDKRQKQQDCKDDSDLEPHENYPFYYVFTKKHIQKWSVINGFVWMTIGLSYYFFYSYGARFGNAYVNFFLLSIVEIPAVLCSSFSGNKIGRKVVIIISLITMGILVLIFSFGITFAPSSTAFHVTLLVTGKLFLSIIWTVIFLHTSEMYPTRLRSTGIAVGTTFARVGTALAPFMVLIGGPLSFVSSFVIASTAFISAILYSLLPETRHWELPQTMMDVYRYLVVDPKELTNDFSSKVHPISSSKSEISYYNDQDVIYAESTEQSLSLR